jgi:hypothetical protein
MKDILHSNDYPLNFRKTINKYDVPNTPTKIEEKQKGKPTWVSFTYAGHDMKKIPKLFSNNNIKMACKTNDMKNLRCKKQNTDTYNNSGIYKLKSLLCSKSNKAELQGKFHQIYQ